MSRTIDARKRASLFAALSILSLAALPGSAAAATETPGETFAASVDPAGEYADGGVTGDPTISADGRFVAFVSNSANLTPEAASAAEAYVKDLETGEVTLASRGEGVGGPPADEPGPTGVEKSLLSASGRYLAFQSSADNLVAGLPAASPPVTHVYRRDLQSGETALVDRADGSKGEVVPLAAQVLAISADGNLVAIYDSAEELEDPTGAHAEGEEAIYVRDLAAGTTTEIAAERAEEAAFSADGRYLLFTSAAPALPEPTGSFEVYRRDLQSGETILVSRGHPTGAAPAGEPADGEAYEAVFVAQSDCDIAFIGEGTSNLNASGEDPPRGVYRRDFCGSAPVTTLLSISEEGEPFEAATFPSTTVDGRVAFLAQGRLFEPAHVYLRDPVTQQTTLLERATGPEGEAANAEPQDERAAMIAANGCRAIFTTRADNLFGEEATLPGGSQTFVRQIAPCKPSPGGGGDSPAGGPSGGGQAPPAASTPAPARSIAVTGLRRGVLSLVFDGAGRARVRIQKLVTNGRGNWKQVKSLIVSASAPEVVRTRLPAFAAGRNRLKIRLQGDPDNPTLTRRFSAVEPPR